MPRLRDVPVAIRHVGWKQLLLSIWNHSVYTDDIFTWASALAYSWLFAMFPFILFLLTLLPHLPQDQKMQVLNSIADFQRQLPIDVATMVDDYVKTTVERVLNERQTLLTLVSLAMCLWIASGGMAATMSALDRCYAVESRSFYTQRPYAMLLTLIVGTLLVVMLAVLPIGGIVIRWLWNNSQRLLGYQLPDALRLVLDVSRWTIGILLLIIILNVVYHFGTRVRRRYRVLTPGAVFCIFSWIAMGLAFREYIDRFAIQGYNQTYGAVGGVVILMFLFYLAASILLIGAEINGAVDYAVLKAPRGTRDLRLFERKQALDEGSESPADPDPGHLDTQPPKPDDLLPPKPPPKPE